MKRVVQVIIAILFLLDVAIIVVRPIRWPRLRQFKRVSAVYKFRLAPVDDQIPINVETVPTPKARAIPIFGNAFSALCMALASAFDAPPLINLGLLFVLRAVPVSVIVALLRPVLVLRSTRLGVVASILLYPRVITPVLILLCVVVLLAVVPVARVLILRLRMIIVVLRQGRKGSEEKQKQHDSRNARESSHADLRMKMRLSIFLLRMWSKARAMLIRNPQIQRYETVFHLGF